MTAVRAEVWQPPGRGLNLDDLPAVDLDRLVAVAELQRRYDRKYVVEVPDLGRLVEALGSGVHVLEVDRRRSTDYTSTYFDTGDLRTFRDHQQRRRRRFKVRTRHYGDPSATVLEVKFKGLRGQTYKRRWPHLSGAPDVLGPEAETLLDEAIRAEYGFGLPGPLTAVATTRFERVTLVDVENAERVTIDLDLCIEANGQRMRLGGSHAVVESKSPVRAGHASRAIAALGLRPERVSKYCVGIIAAHETIRGNRWLPVLRQLEVVPLPPTD